MNSHGLCQVIHVPTRISTQKQSLIDNIYTNYTRGKILCGVIAFDLSDHLPIFINVDKPCTTNSTISNKCLTTNKSQSKQSITKFSYSS